MSWIPPTGWEILTDGSELAISAHMIGLDHKRPYKRHERWFYSPYRNYFDCGFADMPKLLDMEQKGFVIRKDSESTWFHLTGKGIEWLEQQLDVTIHREEA